MTLRDESDFTGRKGDKAVGIRRTKPQRHDDVRHVFSYVKDMTSLFENIICVSL